MQADTTAAAHGKGKSDSIGAWGKTTADRGEMDHECRLVNVELLVQYLREKLARGFEYPGVVHAYRKDPDPVLDGKVTRVGMWSGPELAAEAPAMPTRANMPDCEPFDGTMGYHSARGVGGTDAGKYIFFRRFSCFCMKCREGKYNDCDTADKVGIWDGTAYSNAWVKEAVKAKQPEPAERVESAEKYCSALKEGSWVAIDCGADGDDDGHTFWLAKAKGPLFAAVGDVETGAGAMNIKEGYPVVDVQYYDRYDPVQPLLFKDERLPDTVHAESVIAVKEPLVVTKVGTSRVKVQLSAASARAIGEALECRRPSFQPEWVPE